MLRKLALLILLLCPAIASAVSPQVTISGSAITLLGANQVISLTCTLIDPGQTGMLKVAPNIIPPQVITSATPGTTATCGPLYGNDVILNGFGNANSTYYRVQVFTVSSGTVASTPSLQNFYQVIGVGTVDLSTATPVAPTFLTGPNGSVAITGTLTAASIGPNTSQQHTLPAVASDTIALLAATQTLTNKSLTSASNGNSVTLLCSSGPAAAITGNSSAQTFESCTIPANAVANLKLLRVTGIWSHSTGTATVTYGLTLNGVALWPSNNTASTVGGLSQSANIIETGSTTGNVMTAQSFFSFTTNSLTGLSWTTGQTLAFTFNVANTDQITPLFFLVELIQ